jgi:hypothetical protein
MLLLLMQRMMQVFHILMVEVHIIQVHQKWIQMAAFGRELIFIMVKLMDIKKEIMMKMTFRNMEMITKLKQIQDFLMHQH